jgi:hypothetical protein
MLQNGRVKFALALLKNLKKMKRQITDKQIVQTRLLRLL